MLTLIEETIFKTVPIFHSNLKRFENKWIQISEKIFKIEIKNLIYLIQHFSKQKKQFPDPFPSIGTTERVQLRTLI